MTTSTIWRKLVPYSKDKIESREVRIWSKFRKVLRIHGQRTGNKGQSQKIQAILNMRSLTTLKEVQGLTGMLVALNKFISKATD